MLLGLSQQRMTATWSAAGTLTRPPASTTAATDASGGTRAAWGEMLMRCAWHARPRLGIMWCEGSLFSFGGWAMVAPGKGCAQALHVLQRQQVEGVSCHAHGTAVAVVVRFLSVMPPPYHQSNRNGPSQLASNSLTPCLCAAVSHQLVNWFGAGAVVNGDAAILDFTCPGTVAKQYKLCRSATDAGESKPGTLLLGCLAVVCGANSEN